jgi:hypothetical protein
MALRPRPGHQEAAGDRGRAAERHLLRAVGGRDMPTSSLKRELNEPTLEKPTSMQISVTVRLADRRRSLARSTRRG